MPKNLQRLPKREERADKRTVYHVQVTGLPGCLLGSILFLSLAAVPLLLLLFGVITATVAVWIAFAVVIFAVLNGMLRWLFAVLGGMLRRRP